jgi:hypothetical protein
MARTTEEIKSEMTTTFLANADLRSMYGIAEGTPWSTAFSTVSLENIIFFIVAASIHVIERIFDQFKVDVDEKVENAIVASVPWYHAQALKYQHGDSLVLDDSNYSYGYAEIDETKQVVKYCAVRDMGTSVQVLVSGDNGGSPVAFDATVMTPFTAYMDKIKLAGVVLNCASYASDHVKITANITVDAMVINSDGTLVSDGTTKPVEAAITDYLHNILYGGTFNKTKLVDAIQAVEGVEDVELTQVEVRADSEVNYTILNSNNYVGVSGSYIADNLASTLTYN